MSILFTSDLPLWLRVLCFLSLAPQIICSPVTIPGHDLLVDNLDTSPLNSNATSLLTSAQLGAPVANCASLPNFPQWFAPSQRFDTGDCPKALELFFNDYVKDHEGIKYEFLSSGVTPVHGIPTQRVPLKAAHGASLNQSRPLMRDLMFGASRLILKPGTCVIVIAMRNMFVEGELPGETPSASAGSDISSFTQLYYFAQEIYEKCSEPGKSQPGWYPAGDLNSIAIFIWQGASEIAKRFQIAPPHTGLNLVSTG